MVFEEQEPPKVIVPASVDEKTYSGVVSLVGSVTAVTSETVGDVVSIVKGDIVRALLTLPNVSVTVIVQSE